MSEIHYRYWIGILVSIIVVLLTVNWGSNKALAELLSFGLSFSSLVLAVIAIFQALFSSASLGHVTGSMTKSAEEVRSAASEIKTATADLLQRTQNLPETLGSISNRFDLLQDRLFNARVTDGLGNAAGKAADADQTEYILSHLTVGGMVGLYACVKGFQTKKSFDVSTIITPVNNARYTQGFIAGLWAGGVINAEYEKGKFSISSLNNIDVPRVVTRMDSEDAKGLADSKAKIDAFFGADDAKTERPAQE